MNTNEEIRLHRLRQLCREQGLASAKESGEDTSLMPVEEQAKRGLRVVAAKAEVNWQTLDQIMKGVPLPAKADGTRSPRNVGSTIARQIERAFELGEGWFDWPFDGVDFKQWLALNEAQRAFVQGKLSRLIEEAAEKISRSADTPDSSWIVESTQTKPQPTPTSKPRP